MENLFDFLENKSKEEKQENIILETQTIDISTTQKTKYIIDEEHLKHLEKVKISLYNEDEIKASGLERKDYIRLNSYVGSRLNTDLRAKNNPIITDKAIGTATNQYLFFLFSFELKSVHTAKEGINMAYSPYDMKKFSTGILPHVSIMFCTISAVLSKKPCLRVTSSSNKFLSDVW